MTGQTWTYDPFSAHMDEEGLLFDDNYSHYRQYLRKRYSRYEGWNNSELPTSPNSYHPLIILFSVLISNSRFVPFTMWKQWPVFSVRDGLQRGIMGIHKCSCGCSIVLC